MGSAVQAAESKAKTEADEIAAANAKEEELREQARRKEEARQAQEEKEMEERKMEKQRAAAKLAKTQAMAKAGHQAKMKAKRKAETLAAFLKTHESSEAKASVSIVADVNSNPSEFVLSLKGFTKYRGSVLSSEQKRERQEKEAAMKAGVKWLTDNISQLTRPQVQTRSAKTRRTTKRQRTSFNKSLSVLGGVWDKKHAAPLTALVHPEQQLVAVKKEVSILRAMLREQKQLSVAKRFPIR